MKHYWVTGYQISTSAQCQARGRALSPLQPSRELLLLPRSVSQSTSCWLHYSVLMVSIVCVDVFIAAPGPGQPATCQVLEESGTTWFLLTVVQCSAGPELSGKMVLRFLKICCSCPARWWRWLASVRAEGCWRTVVETALPLPGYHRPQISESNLYPTLHTMSTATTLTAPTPLNTFIHQQSLTPQWSSQTDQVFCFRWKCIGDNSAVECSLQ